MDREPGAPAPAGREEVVNAIAVDLGGSFSAEHGIGQSKRHAMATHKDAGGARADARGQGGARPAGLMNPGKMLP